MSGVVPGWTDEENWRVELKWLVTESWRPLLLFISAKVLDGGLKMLVTAALVFETSFGLACWSRSSEV